MVTTYQGVELSQEDAARIRFERLPKWAQEQITSLERELAIEKRTNAELKAKHKGSNVSYNSVYTGVMDETTLPRDSHVTFYMEPEREGKSHYLRRSITVHHARSAYGPEVYVTTNGGRLTVLPSASNSVRLRIDER